MNAYQLVFLGVATLSASPTHTSHAFSSSIPLLSRRPTALTTSSPTRATTTLNGGVGTAETYSWNEEQFEIELKLSVPPGTSAKDVKFKCSSESIDLKLLSRSDTTNNDDEPPSTVLLDGTRKVRGKICVDGTFWSIEGPTTSEDGNKSNREITITIEKHFVPISTSGGAQTYDTLTDFDWGGIYPNDENEVTFRKYDEAEELNVREYAAKLGVDIDNLDMSKVDKSMFGSGLGEEAGAAANNAMGGMDDNNLEQKQQENGEEEGTKDKGSHFNITQTTLEQLTKSGFAKEVMQQGDGSEYEIGSDGSLNEDNLFSMLGKDVSSDELREAGILGGGGGGGGGGGLGGNIPAMWETSTLPVEEAPGYQKTYDVAGGNDALVGGGIIENEIIEQEISSFDDDRSVVDVVSQTEGELVESADTISNDLEPSDTETVQEGEGDDDASTAVDPIDMLTVVKLKEILRAQGLKVSGTKQVLRDRLRNQVNVLLEEE